MNPARYVESVLDILGAIIQGCETAKFNKRFARDIGTRVKCLQLPIEDIRIDFIIFP